MQIVDLSDECIICNGPKNSGLQILRCGHVYHFHCIQNWFRVNPNNHCPLCRRENRNEPIIEVMISPLPEQVPVRAPRQAPIIRWHPYSKIAEENAVDIVEFRIFNLDYLIRRMQLRYCYNILYGLYFLSLLFILLEPYKDEPHVCSKISIETFSCPDYTSYTIFNCIFMGLIFLMSLVSSKGLSTVFDLYDFVHMIHKHGYFVATFITSIVLMSVETTPNGCTAKYPTCRDILWKSNPNYVFALWIPLIVMFGEIIIRITMSMQFKLERGGLFSPDYAETRRLIRSLNKPYLTNIFRN
uniref:RING-type domain-containing protein n=1 Tax=viral metagenome TaxID=1070528 RepID=A0A6C0ELL0_9ZZZZ